MSELPLIGVSVILLIVFFILLGVFSTKSGFTNYTLAEHGKFPQSQVDVLVQDTYPRIKRYGISNNNSNDMWWHYPIFKEGSYAQITNNIRYPNNPDLGNCMPGSMCGSLYHEKKIGDNYINQLPVVNPESGTRVGYFSATENTFFPYRSVMQNILY